MSTKPKALAAPPGAATPMEMLDRAITQNASVETLARLMDLQERWDRNQARVAFEAALAACKQEIPVIIKDREVDFTSTKGRTNYKYEDLASIAKIVDPILAERGITYRFRTEAKESHVTVTCIVSGHGYREENSLSAPVDLSGNKNAIQAIGSTCTYLQRYTLKTALGLAAAADEDARTEPAAEMLVNDEQVRRLKELVDQSGTDLVKLLKWAQVDNVEKFPLSLYPEAISVMKRRIAEAEAPANEPEDGNAPA